MSFNFSVPAPGDIIYADRGLYKHYGIYIGEGQVIHFAGPKGHETDPALADVIQTSLKDFLKQDLLCVQENNGKKPLPVSEVVQRAKPRLGKCKGTYNLAGNNCEHFANWCRYGTNESQQVDAVATCLAKIIKSILRPSNLNK